MTLLFPGLAATTMSLLAVLMPAELFAIILCCQTRVDFLLCFKAAPFNKFSVSYIAASHLLPCFPPSCLTSYPGWSNFLRHIIDLFCFSFSFATTPLAKMLKFEGTYTGGCLFFESRWDVHSFSLAITRPSCAVGRIRLQQLEAIWRSHWFSTFFLPHVHVHCFPRISPHRVWVGSPSCSVSVRHYIKC